MKLRLLLSLSILCSGIARADVDPEEASLLHRKGREAFLSGNDAEAVRNLDRLTSLYPADRRSLESFPLLGESLSRSGKPMEAIEAFRAYAERTADLQERLRTWVRIGETKLRMGKTDEALFTARDTLAKGHAIRMGRGVETDARLLEIDALIARDRGKEARAAFQSLQRFLTDAEESGEALGPRLLDREISLETKNCASGSPDTPLSEEELLAETAEAGRCLMETLLKAAGATAKHPAWLAPDLAPFQEEFRRFMKRAEHPPASSETLSKEQAAEYRSQMGKILARETEAVRARILDWVGTLEKSEAWASRRLGDRIRGSVAP